MSVIAVAADRDPPAAPAEPASGAHRATLERVFGLIYAVFMALMMAVFWSSSFLGNNSDVLVIPVAAGWAVWSGRLAVPVPLLLVILASWTGDPGVLAVEQAASALALIACTASAARLLRAGARQADADADDLSRKMAAEDAAIAAEEAERRAANAVHDDVLSVLRAVGVADQPLPWSLVVTKAKGALDALARQVPGSRPGLADLSPALRRQASQVAAELDVRLDIDDGLDLPRPAVEALGAAAGEALRNVAAHAGVGRAVLTARRGQSGRVAVTISDEGAGFDPAGVGPARSGLRNSIRARMANAGGHAEIISAPGRGTSVVLTWSPPHPAGVPVTDPLAWARRMLPRPLPIFVGLMLPVLLLDLIAVCLRWPDMRWQGAAVAVLGGFTGLAVLSARYLSQMRMTGPAAVGLAAANTVLAAVAFLAVAPGTTDSLAYWAAGVSGIVVAAIYFTRGRYPAWPPWPSTWQR